MQGQRLGREREGQTETDKHIKRRKRDRQMGRKIKRDRDKDAGAKTAQRERVSGREVKLHTNALTTLSVISR